MCQYIHVHIMFHNNTVQFADEMIVITVFPLDVTNSTGPLCLKCQDATSVDECRQQNKAPCGDDEVRYLRNIADTV